MTFLGFKSCQADSDIYMRESTKTDGKYYWEYVLLYVYECLVSNHGENMQREDIGKYFKLKENSIGPPDVYPGGKMRQVKLDNGSKAWAFSSSQYVVEAVKTVEAYLARKEKKLNDKAGAPISDRYRPFTNTS